MVGPVEQASSETPAKFGCFTAKPMKHNEPNGSAGELMLKL